MNKQLRYFALLLQFFSFVVAAFIFLEGAKEDLVLTVRYILRLEVVTKPYRDRLKGL